jgi:hypothetical protein
VIRETTVSPSGEATEQKRQQDRWNHRKESQFDTGRRSVPYACQDRLPPGGRVAPFTLDQVAQPVDVLNRERLIQAIALDGIQDQLLVFFGRKVGIGRGHVHLSTLLHWKLKDKQE